MTDNVKRPEDITLGELFGEMIPQEERTFGLIPPSLFGAELTAEEQLSINLAHFYGIKMDKMIYWKLLKKDREHYNSKLPYLAVRIARVVYGVIQGKTLIATIALLVIILILSLALPTGLGVGIGIVLTLLLITLCLKVEKTLIEESGFKKLILSPDEIDETTAQCEVVLTVARRELKKLEEDGGLPEGAWPFADEIWNEIISKKARNLDEALMNLGFEFEDEE